jgi:hypothetical protein
MESINPYALVHNVKPALRLQLLHAYICWRIDQWPQKVVIFEDWFVQRFSHLIPGTIEHARKVATRCFYCNSEFTTDKLRIPTSDHYDPKSKGFTDKYVICCFDCNNRKANINPEVLLSKMSSAIAYNKEMWGYTGKKLRFIHGQFDKVFKDRINGTGPVIYYFKH